MPVNSKTPKSYFFTEPNRITQVESQAFGPVPGALERKFNLTNLFTKSGSTDLKAFAVTDGILFIVPQKDNPNLVNIFLKPTTPVDIGVKIKYYVYRSVKIENFFAASGSSFDLLPKDDPKIIPFLVGIWNEFLEFNGLSGPDVSFEANKIGFSTTDASSYQSFFTKDKYSLPKVKIGDHIGNFDSEFGFEIIVDEGDFSQEKSDTGFEFREDFFRARKCVLNLDNNNDSKDYGNLPSVVSEKIFRESIYLFLDPAAYYGSHVTGIKDNSNGGSIKIKENNIENEVKTIASIYNKILNRFINKDKVYIYIKSNRNRSYKFYKPETDRNLLYCSNTNTSNLWVPIPFNINKWPIFVKTSVTHNEGFNIGAISGSIISSNIILSEVKISQIDTFILRTDNLLLDPHPFNIKLPLMNDVSNISQIVYLDFFDRNEDPSNNFLPLNNIFSKVNINSIFEREDFADKQGSFINNLRATLIQEGLEAAVYKAKVILDGNYIANVDPGSPPPSDAELSQNLRTYILFPQSSTIVKDETNIKSPTAGYFSLINNVDEYVEKIYNDGELWKGVIKDGSSTLKCFLHQSRNGSLPIYQLGISQREYKKLVDRDSDPSNIPIDAINFFFCFENEQVSPNSSFIKYDLKIEFDDINGVKNKTKVSISIYTIDGYFFFTEDYSVNFKYFKEFADIAVDFLPTNLIGTVSGYNCGFDFIGHKVVNDPLYSALNRDRYPGIVGNYSNGNFHVESKRFLNLAAYRYNAKPTNWRNKVDDFPFHTDSFITLYPNRETTVTLKFTKQVTPNELYISYNKNFVSINNLSTGKFVIPKANYGSAAPVNNYTIKIKCLQILTEDIPLEVFAINKNGKKSLAGRCWLRRNSEKYKIEVALVNCITDINSMGSPTPGILPGHADVARTKIRNFLNQILVEPDFGATLIDLDLTNEPKFKIGGTYIVNNGVVSTTSMFEFCTTYNDSMKALKNKCILLFFGIPSSDPNLNGEATIYNDYVGGAYGARIFVNGIPKNTIPHELLHSIGLYHSFDDQGEFTFEKLKTDNLMDYTTDEQRILLWYWQDIKVKRTSNNNKLKLI